MAMNSWENGHMRPASGTYEQYYGEWMGANIRGNSILMNYSRCCEKIYTTCCQHHSYFMKVTIMNVSEWATQ